MIFSKQELHRRGDDVTRKGWTTRFYHDFLDSVWREPFINRSSGFDMAGGPDSVIAFDNNTRIFTISPVTNKFAFWQFIVRISFFKRYEPMELEIPDEEGLYLIYLFRDEEDETHKRQILHFIKNPTNEQIGEVYLHRVIVAWIYWNFNDKSTVYFGDERHGSEWNPKIHLWAHEAFNALWKSGFSVTGLNPGDGSDNSHAQFGIASGEFSHEDMEHAIPGVGPATGLPVLWFHGTSPAIESNPGYSFLRGPDFLFNNAGNTKTECTDGFFMLYHLLASNCQLYPLISVMGLKQYENKNDCCKAAYGEMQEIKRKLPQQTVLPVASFAFEVSHEFTNDVKARIVEPCSGQGCFLWIENVLNWYDIQIQIEIEEADSEVLTDKSVTGDGTLGSEIELVNDEETPGDLKYYGTGDAEEPDKGFHHLYSKLVNQTSHGFAVKQAIRHNGTSFVLAQADSATNAQVAGIVVEVIDANNFRYQSEGFFAHDDWVAGTEYFLSPSTAGLVTTEHTWVYPDDEGKVRQHLGYGTDRGLKIEIDVGDVISGESVGGLSSVETEKHVTGTGEADNKVRLVGDVDAPITAPNKYYGTKEGNDDGFHDLPEEQVQVLTGTTPTFDMENGRGATITLTADTTITFANLKANDNGHIEVKQDATGGHRLIFSGVTVEISEYSFAAASEVELTGVAGSNDVVAWWYTGTTMKLAVIYNFLAI